MLHLIMTLLVHGAYMENTKCPEACSCIENLISNSYKAVSLKIFDETIPEKTNQDQAEDEYNQYLSGVETIKTLHKLKVIDTNDSYRLSQAKKCGEKKEDVRGTFLRNLSLKSIKISSNFTGLYNLRTKRAANVRYKISFNETSQNVKPSENKLTVTGKPSASDMNKDVFTYQITCIGLRDLKSVWIQYLPGPATELSIQRTNFQSFKAFKQILKESSIELNQLTVLSVSDSIINQSPDKNYSVKTELTSRKKMSGAGKHSDFLPFASLQNPKPRPKSEMKFSSNGKSRNLQVLNLTNTTIVSLPRDTFHPFINLRILNLSNNFIEFIENETFSSLVNLLHLDVHNNRLRFLNEIMFKNLTKLIFLDVSNNLLSDVEPSTFQYLLSLNVLNLASNPLSEKQEAVVLLGTGKRLQIVDISKTGLKQIPGTLERSVRVLNLMGNFLLSIRCGDLDSYFLLSYLNLKSNKISYIEDDALGRLEFLKNLQISDNNLFQIPKILPNNLEILNLSFNNIQNITNSDFLNLSFLKELSLSYNQVISIEENAFSSLIHLKVLDLSRNPILVFPSISARIKLVVLNLSYLTNIPENYSAKYKKFPVQSPKSVKHLNLESSPVLTKTFLLDTKTLKSFISLKELNFRFTNLTTIRKDIFSLLPQLNVLKVEGNPWHCNREILTLSTWLRSHENGKETGNEDEVNTAHCLTPPELYKTNLIILNEKDFAEKEQSERKHELMSALTTKMTIRDPQILDLHNESQQKSKNVSNTELTTFMGEIEKRNNKTSGNDTLLSLNYTENSNCRNCSGDSEPKFQSSNDLTKDYTQAINRDSNQGTSMSSFSEGDLWTTISTDSPNKLKNSVNLKSKQVTLLALKNAEAITSKDTLSLKTEYNSHLSFFVLSSIGLVVMATLAFTSLYFTRARRDQSYHRQNQDIEVCSISSLRNEIW